MEPSTSESLLTAHPLLLERFLETHNTMPRTIAWPAAHFWSFFFAIYARRRHLVETLVSVSPYSDAHSLLRTSTWSFECIDTTGIHRKMTLIFMERQPDSVDMSEKDAVHELETELGRACMPRNEAEQSSTNFVVGMLAVRHRARLFIRRGLTFVALDGSGRLGHPPLYIDIANRDHGAIFLRQLATALVLTRTDLPHPAWL